jgi:hypothetical protein
MRRQITHIMEGALKFELRARGSRLQGPGAADPSVCRIAPWRSRHARFDIFAPSA